MAKVTQRLNEKRIYVTPEGLAKARQELEFLKTIKRAEVSQRIQGARELGDLSENSEYDAAIAEFALLETKIEELEDSLKSIQLITNGHSSEAVSIGSTVRVKMDDGDGEYMIVGKLEADPHLKKISNESPLGAALLGGKLGEIVQISTPDFSYSAKIIEIK